MAADSPGGGRASIGGGSFIPSFVEQLGDPPLDLRCNRCFDQRLPDAPPRALESRGETPFIESPAFAGGPGVEPSDTLLPLVLQARPESKIGRAGGR
jgi:hypothetical protein